MSHQPWTPAEETDLLSAFDRGVAIKELAASHQRTRGAIKARLVRLGRLEAPSAGDLPGNGA